MIKVKKFEVKIQSHEEFGEETRKELEKIEKGKYPEKPVRTISFPNLEELKKILSPNRLRLLKTVKHSKPVSIYQLAQLVERNVANVNKDLKELETLGLVELSKSKKTKRTSLTPKVNYRQIAISISI